MAHYWDLSPYCYYDFGGEPAGMVNVGWLSPLAPYRLGKTSSAFRETLRTFCENPPEATQTRGLHWCGFCGRVACSNEMRAMGGARAYAAPSLVHHYVVAHWYRPPEEFVSAVMEGPSPGSPEYWKHFGDTKHNAFHHGESVLTQLWNILMPNWPVR